MGRSAGCSIEKMRANAFSRNMATRRAAWSPAYGGSAKATSYWPGWSRSANLSASRRRTTARSSRCSVLMFALRADSAKRFRSTNSAVAAPRDSDSRPSAPEPARPAEPVRQPGIRYDIGPPESDSRQHPGAVVEREAQVVRAHPPGADGARAAHPEDGRGIARTTGLQVAHQPLELGAHQPQ